MKEVGIDISGHRSKSVDEFAGRSFDYLLTVCDNAKESCPVYPGHANRLHHAFEDPATAGGSEEQRLALFRRVHYEIRDYLKTFPREEVPASSTHFSNRFLGYKKRCLDGVCEASKRARKRQRNRSGQLQITPPSKPVKYRDFDKRGRCPLSAALWSYPGCHKRRENRQGAVKRELFRSAFC